LDANPYLKILGILSVTVDVSMLGILGKSALEGLGKLISGLGIFMLGKKQLEISRNISTILLLSKSL
jgi:hypothetical protein